MNEIFVVGGLGVLAVAVVGYVLTYLAFLRKAGPNEVIVVSGRGRVKFITGGADMVIPLFHTWNRLSLEVMTLDVTTPEVYTSQGAGAQRVASAWWWLMARLGGWDPNGLQVTSISPVSGPIAGGTTVTVRPPPSPPTSVGSSRPPEGPAAYRPRRSRWPSTSP